MTAKSYHADNTSAKIISVEEFAKDGSSIFSMYNTQNMTAEEFDKLWNEAPMIEYPGVVCVLEAIGFLD